jgi:hypothetical protein
MFVGAAVFFAYLMMLSVALIIWCLMMLVSNEFERMWKGMAMANLEYYLGVCL